MGAYWNTGGKESRPVSPKVPSAAISTVNVSAVITAVSGPLACCAQVLKMKSLALCVANLAFHYFL